MKNPAYRPLVTPLRTYRRWPANIPQWPAIMSTSAMAPGRFWRVWTCTTGTSPRALRSATGVWGSTPCSGFGCPLPAGVHDSDDPGQPLRAHFQRDAGLLGDAPQPVQVRADSYAWLLAEYRGDPLWQDDAHVPAADSGAIQSGTERAYSVGDRRNQRDASGPSLEDV